MTGVSAVQLSSMGGGSSGGDGGNKNGLLGVSAVLAATATSGFAGVYFEKVPQRKKITRIRMCTRIA